VVPGSILVSSDTLRLVEGLIEVKPLGRIQAKGLVDPVELIEVLDSGMARSGLQVAAARGLPRFVGREQLRGAPALVAQGCGQVVTAAGETGVGKSGLFLEFAREVGSQGWRCLETSSASYGKASSYRSLIDLLKHCGGMARGKVIANHPSLIGANAIGSFLAWQLSGFCIS